jgi:hypothetical protein
LQIDEESGRIAVTSALARSRQSNTLDVKDVQRKRLNASEG